MTLRVLRERSDDSQCVATLINEQTEIRSAVRWEAIVAQLPHSKLRLCNETFWQYRIDNVANNQSTLLITTHTFFPIIDDGLSSAFLPSYSLIFRLRNEAFNVTGWDFGAVSCNVIDSTLKSLLRLLLRLTERLGKFPLALSRPDDRGSSSSLGIVTFDLITTFGGSDMSTLNFQLMDNCTESSALHALRSHFTAVCRSFLHTINFYLHDIWSFTSRRGEFFTSPAHWSVSWPKGRRKPSAN